MFAAGVAGTAAMMAASKAAGSPVMDDLRELAGTVAAPVGSRASDAVGLTIHLVNGGLFAQLYGAVLGPMAPQVVGRAGATMGAVHGVLAGVLLGAVPTLHPHVPEQIAAPRVFLLRRGFSGAIALVALHVLYGAIVAKWAAPRRLDLGRRVPLG